MRVHLATFATLGLCLHAQAQQNASALISALQAAGLTRLADAIQSVNGTQTGQNLINELTSGSANYTVFAPNNAAFDAPEVSAVSNDPDQLANILSYHVLPGNFVNSSVNASALDSGTLPVVTLGRTQLNNQTLVHLEGNKSQVLAWTRNDTSSNSTIYFLNQDPQVNVLNTTSVGRLLVAEVSGVLIPPGDFSEVANANNLSAIVGLVNMVNVPDFYPNGTNATVERVLEANSTRGFTLFAPDNQAVERAGSSLSSLSNNQTALLGLLGNHYINGTSYYSSQLLSQNSSDFVSASGQPFNFNSNSSGTFVTSANGASAKIVKSDVLVNNGVIHIIDNVLVNTNRDEGKASSAYQSATSVAAQSTTQTGPIGGATSSASPTGSNNANNSNGAISAGVVSAWSAIVLGAFGWVVFMFVNVA